MPRPERRPSPPSSVSELAALAKLFEEHRARLLAMVRRRIDPALAARFDPEEILAEAFLRSVDRWSDYDPEAMSTYTWLYRIVLDCVIEAWRKANAAGRSIQREVPWPERSSVQLGLGLVGSTTSPSEAFARAELRERITWAVQQLKPDDREILGMRHFDDLSYQDAAAVLGISPDAAMQRYVRALRRLKLLWNKIEPRDQPEPEP
ncbi:MAG: sigma-70 family RNA polymerase sigma factor [Isosphaerales bacterium]